jgi:arylsulfatase A-like enzyme
MAAFKASARSLDHGVGGVLNALMDSGLDDRTLVVCTTDHGLALPGLKAGLLDGGIGVMLIVRGPGGFTGGKVIDALVSQIDLYPTFCELAGVDVPEFVQGRSLLSLVRGETGAVRDEVFAEITYHAAYEPQRAVRTDRYKLIRRFDSFDGPVLPNTDEGPTKDALVELGWAGWATEEERLHDVLLDPGEGRNLIADPAYAGVARDLRKRLSRWMEETGDPLLHGPVGLPPRGRANSPRQRSADEPMTELGPELLDERRAA